MYISSDFPTLGNITSRINVKTTRSLRGKFELIFRNDRRRKRLKNERERERKRETKEIT